MPCKHQAAQIGDVLTHRELAVDLDVIHGNILRILVREAAGTLLKLLPALGRPPIAQIALRVKLAAVIVEAVGEFVSNRAPLSP
jgi:hypothetical protein